MSLNSEKFEGQFYPLLASWKKEHWMVLFCVAYLQLKMLSISKQHRSRLDHIPKKTPLYPKVLFINFQLCLSSYARLEGEGMTGETT